MSFKGKVVAVTGAAGGIGQAVCRYFAGEGAVIAAIDKKDTVSSFADELKRDGVKTAYAVADIGDAEAVAKAFAHLAAALGPVDILINNAGYSDHPTLARTDPKGWQADMNGNLNGAYNCAHAVLPGMQEKRQGSIIAVGSVNGLSALGDPAYSAAKAGMISLTRSLALEYGRYGIRSNIVLPATVRTPLWDARAKKDPKVLATLTRWYPLGRIVEPLDVAKAIGFLASDAAAAITGVALPVDCGLTSGNIVMTRELTLEDF
ncbi:SDR family oxidoreductase [Aestuariivirga sp. YIM B02566]|uniref:SDR family oxidoreductase n=1 Tax=Taklimakanibacter albus TaxID=2800327 RepID=A0ACC5RDH4_9HYPH|nr:SDR family oxidoreductase [Aestuariivirga sp. YIM B02566]MBK1870710.1 SDR family oxidoreductase [Aestuariivirga sp. YIM B02566]